MKPTVTDIEKVAPAGSYLPAVTGGFAELLRDNLAGQQISPFDLERVKLPAGGALYWTVKSAEHPEGEPRKEIVGVILRAKVPGRTFWARGFDEGGGGQQPDCYSDDGMSGIGVPGGLCHKCPNARFGSAAKGGGQACKTTQMLFVACPDSMLPRVIAVSPGSLKALRSYMVSLSNIGYKYMEVATRFELEAATNKGGIKFARMKPSLISRLSESETEAARAMVRELMPVFEQVRAERTEVDGTSDGGLQ